MTRELVIVGAGPAGLEAASELVGALPYDLATPIVFVARGAKLDFRGSRRIVEVADKDELRQGVVHLAPRGYHLLVDGDHFALSREDEASGARPSFEVLALSAAETFGARLTAVLLEGAEADGERGAFAVRARGGLVLAVEEAKMPAEAADRVIEVGAVGGVLRERLAGERVR